MVKLGGFHIGGIGTRATYTPLEVSLTKKLNNITFWGSFILLGVVLFYLILGIYPLFWHTFTLLVATFGIFLLNKYKNYLWAIYYLYLISFVFFYFQNQLISPKSYILLFYFPLTVSIIQLLGHRSLYKHMVILLSICVTFFFLTALAPPLFSPNQEALLVLEPIQYLVIVSSILTSFIFIGVIVIESNKQERIILGILQEKAELLSELNHRVKNNMNIMTSLLNMKKNMVEGKEAKEALKDMQNKIYSMALVHNLLLNFSVDKRISFQDYVSKLSNEIVDSNSIDNQVKLDLNIENQPLSIEKVIPLGLILNELIVNSLKHAKVEGTLIIKIDFNRKKNAYVLIYTDNGSPFSIPSDLDETHLGMDLIQSLADQLDAQLKMDTSHGMEVKILF